MNATHIRIEYRRAYEAAALARQEQSRLREEYRAGAIGPQTYVRAKMRHEERERRLRVACAQLAEMEARV